MLKNADDRDTQGMFACLDGEQGIFACPAFLRLRVLGYGVMALKLASMFDADLNDDATDFERQTRKGRIQNVTVSVLIFKWLIQDLWS